MASVRFARVRRLTVIGAVGVITIVVASPVVGGSGIGAIFNLGKTNTVTTTTTLKGSSATRLLQVTNVGAGAALQLTTGAGAPPLKVNSSVKVANLNADQLDGLHSSDFMAAGAHPDAATLSGIPASGFVQPSGLIEVQVGASTWRPISSGTALDFLWSSSSTAVSRGSAGYDYIAASPDLPVAMFGQALQLDAVEVCYRTGTSTELTGVEINTPSSTAGDANPTNVFYDYTVRTDTACRIYTLATPAVLGYSNTANVYLTVHWLLQFATFEITRATFILEPTGTAAVAPAAPAIVTHASVGIARPSVIPSAPSK